MTWDLAVLLFESPLSRRKAVERQLEHCSQQREEALKLLRKLTSLFRGCHHPQLLPQSVVESYQAAMVRVRAIGEELQAQEKSGDPDHTRVRGRG